MSIIDNSVDDSFSRIDIKKIPPLMKKGYLKKNTMSNAIKEINLIAAKTRLRKENWIC